MFRELRAHFAVHILSVFVSLYLSLRHTIVHIVYFPSRLIHQYSGDIADWVRRGSSQEISWSGFSVEAVGGGNPAGSVAAPRAQPLFCPGANNAGGNTGGSLPYSPVSSGRTRSVGRQSVTARRTGTTLTGSQTAYNFFAYNPGLTGPSLVGLNCYK